MEVGTLLAIGSAVSGAASIASSVMGAGAQQEALETQRKQVQQKEKEERSDRMRQARSELGTLRAMELGSASGLNRMVTELAYIEGVDLNRIRTSRAQAEKAISARQKDVETGMWTGIASAVIETGLSAYTGGQTAALGAKEREADLLRLGHTEDIYTLFK